MDISEGFSILAMAQSLCLLGEAVSSFFELAAVWNLIWVLTLL